MEDEVVGRKHQRKLLAEALNSSAGELVAIFGRRRVGKTFLIRETYKAKFMFKFSGVQGATLKQQLFNFSLALQKASGVSGVRPVPPTSWIEAFHQLEEYLLPKLKRQKLVIFFDELPWLHTARSGFLGAFEHFWNSWAVRQPNLVVVICGSAASWMIRRIVNNKGGLHNRITQKIRLLPFDLHDTEAYLKSRNVNLDHYQLLQLYMVTGGIPQYLKAIQPGESATQAIDRICFTKDGVLRDEFNNLYTSLFETAEMHISIVKALAATGKGLNRNGLIEACGLSSGGTATKLLEELEESGFITPYIPFGKTIKYNIYRLTDEFSLFYLKFMQRSRSTGAGTWTKIAATPAWRAWSGIAFEAVCIKHATQLKAALGISGVLTQESVWRHDQEPEMTQIDMLIDRRDQCINLCEMKYVMSEFSIDKNYAAELQRKITLFMQKSKTRKSLFLTMVTTFGVKQNLYYTGLVQSQLSMDVLFTSL